MPRFSDRAREELLDEYARLKAQNISDAQIARRFGVSQMTILRWKQRYGLAERPLPPAGVTQSPRAEEGRPQASLERNGELSRALAGPPAIPTAAERSPTTHDLEALAQENAWLRELASRLLLENEQLRAQLAGRLRQPAEAG